MSFGDLSKWNLSDYRCFVCYYSKMYFNQVWRTWKPFDLDQTRNFDANWIRITLSIRNHVKNRSDHWCWTSIVVSASFSTSDKTHLFILREHTKNDSVKTFYPAETLLTSSQETTLMPHTVRYSTQWFILLYSHVLLSGWTKGGPSTEINNGVELIYKQVVQNYNIEYCNLSWYYIIQCDVAWQGDWKQAQKKI